MTDHGAQTSVATTAGIRVFVRCRYVPEQSGVVGEQPLLHSGEHFEYTSGCLLQTPTGHMRASYRMHRADGRMFDATIAPFLLAPPHSMN
jgi:uncharacterized protein affecting Mg2+/Co2+ transport